MYNLLFYTTGSYKRMKGMPKKHIFQYLDQMIFEGWMNAVLSFNQKSYFQGEKDKTFNTQLMLLVRLSELYCNDESEQLFETNFVSNGGYISIYEDLYDYYKDQGYMDDNDNVPLDDVYEEDLLDNRTSSSDNNNDSNSDYKN